MLWGGMSGLDTLITLMWIFMLGSGLSGFLALWLNSKNLGCGINFGARADLQNC